MEGAAVIGGTPMLPFHSSGKRRGLICPLRLLDVASAFGFTPERKHLPRRHPLHVAD